MTTADRTPFRTETGGRIDRGTPVTFTFNGRRYTGCAGDTLASALLANGVHLVGRSFKYHRPRGILSAGAEEPNAIVQVGTGAYSEPNVRATVAELYGGLVAESVNAWPSVEFDLGAVNGRLSRLFVAGFYYKTFMKPKRLWEKLYEPAIRRMAGMGKAPTLPDADTYDKMHVHADVLVVGGGPAGLAAALAAGRTGARVMLVDEQAEFGGALLGNGQTVDGRPGTEWVADVVAELESLPEVTLLRRATAFGYYDHNFVSVVERRTDHAPPGSAPGQPRQRLWHVRAKRVVLATGAHERPLVFADNDRPGVMLAGAVRTYLNRYGVKAGTRAVVFTNNDSAYRAALDLHAAGVAVVAVVDLRPGADGPLAVACRERNIEILAGQAVVATHGTNRVRAVEVMSLTADGSAVAGVPRRIDCDLVAMSGGWNPAVHLFSQAQGKLRFDDALACFVPDVYAQAQECVGACNGRFALAEGLEEGLRAGARAAQAAGFGNGEAPAGPATEPEPEAPLRPLWVVPGRAPLGRGKARHFVDFQNDVTVGDVRLAAREGMHSVEHLKRYTATGMGTDQGKTSNVNALAILSQEVNRAIPATGTTTFRPPYTPVSYGVLAGRDLGPMLDPIRVTAIHPWHVAHGAVFEDVGQWKRPWYYPRAGETMRDAVARECTAVRTAVGVLDASTLGKIDIQGPDAAEFLNRIYTNAWKKLAIGRCRYGLMCKADGMVMDDGVTSRLGENHFLMTTTTGNAALVLDWLEEWLQTEWPDLKVYCTSVTEQWATVSIAGPKARVLMQDLAPDMDVSKDGFPFMSFKEGTVAGIDARVFRISFTGELSYEINVPSWYGLALWEAVMEAGAKYGITPYGTETMHVLRAEKGFIIVGQETDGTVTPFDLGMDWAVKKSADFIGRRSFSRPDTRCPDRKQLVGLLPEDPEEVLPEGAQLVLPGVVPESDLVIGRRIDPYKRKPVPMAGHVTSSYWSSTLERGFALALVKGGRERIGETILVPLEGRVVKARITEPVFYDKEGSRRDG